MTVTTSNRWVLSTNRNIWRLADSLVVSQVRKAMSKADRKAQGANFNEPDYHHDWSQRSCGEWSVKPVLIYSKVPPVTEACPSHHLTRERRRTSGREWKGKKRRRTRPSFYGVWYVKLTALHRAKIQKVIFRHRLITPEFYLTTLKIIIIFNHNYCYWSHNETSVQTLWILLSLMFSGLMLWPGIF